MSAEEKKKNEQSVENSIKVEEESDFSDEAKPVEAPLEETKEEPEKEKEPEVDLYMEEKEGKAEEEPKKNPKGGYQYEDEELQKIEDCRAGFYAKYKKLNIVKWIITIVGLVIILAGWIIPSSLKSMNSQITMYISLGSTVVVLAAIAIYSFLYRKKVDADMKVYFKEYYEHANKFVYGEKAESLTGSVDDKLPQELFVEAGIYQDVVKVGSRACLHFDYKGTKAVVADCAAQKRGERALQTIFIGKYLKFEGSYSKDEILIYFKGNKRALPPNSLKNRELIEDSKTMVIYGQGRARSLLTKKVREALSRFHTNKTFIDMSVLANDLGLYFTLGYEDDLMVLPLEKPLNPAPLTQAMHDMECVFDLVDAIKERH